MFTKNEFEEILKNLDESLVLDNDNSCVMEVREFFDLTLHFDEPSNHIIAFCEIGKMPANNKELSLSLTKELLTANFSWKDTFGGSISMLEQENIFVYQSVYLKNSLDDFNDFLDRNIHNCEFWIAQYKSLYVSFATELSDYYDDETFVLEDDEMVTYNTNDQKSVNDQTVFLSV